MKNKKSYMYKHRKSGAYKSNCGSCPKVYANTLVRYKNLDILDLFEKSLMV